MILTGLEKFTEVVSICRNTQTVSKICDSTPLIEKSLLVNYS